MKTLSVNQVPKTWNCIIGQSFNPVKELCDRQNCCFDGTSILLLYYSAVYLFIYNFVLKLGVILIIIVVTTTYVYPVLSCLYCKGFIDG